MMLCCCRKGKNTSYALGESNKDANLNTSIAENADNAKIQTGKGALSSSNQSIGPEAELDKGTVAATQQQRQSAPVTEQPVTPASSSPQNHQQPPKVVSVPPVNASQIQPQVEVSPKSSSSTKVVEEDKKVGSSSSSSSNIVESSSQSVQHSTTIKVESSSKKNQNNKIEENLKQELDSIELAITEAEQGNSSPRELKSSLIPQLASQLQALTLQVTEAGQGHRMADLQSAVSRLEAVASRLESLAAKGGGGGGASADEVAPFVIEYDAILNGPLAEYLKVSNDIGGDVKTHSAMVKGTFDAVRDFLVVASKSKKPSQDAMVELLKPVGSKVIAVQEYRESNRRSEFFNHLSTISESITACGWISVTPTPAPFVKEALESGTFYSNRVLKDFKEKDPRHVQWTKSWTNVIKELQQYVKSNHTTGVTWNPQGVDAMSCAASAAPAPAVGGPPPPPPPPPPGPPPPPVSDAPSGPDDSAKNALFASINQGDNVTQGLRKVTDNMKTHKNPALRQGPAPFKAASPKPTPAAKPVVASKAVSVVKPPVLEKQGKKWVIEYQKDNKNISIDGDIKETLYAYKCEGSVIQVKGKINSVVLDSCKKTAVVLDDVLSSVEFVNCQSVQGQVTGKVNTLSIDKTDGCQFYLSKSSMNAEIVSAKSSEMNVLIPMDDGDFKEFALPEQYKTKYNGTTMVTTAAESI